MPVGKLILLCTNVCSIRNKWAELVILTEDRKADIVGVLETWLTESDHVPRTITDGFDVHRVDRSSTTQGGGVALLVRKELPHLKLDIRVCTHNIQMCAVSLISKNRKTTVASVYRSPGANHDEDSQLIKGLEELAKHSQKLIIVGDFNLPDIQWDTEVYPRDTPEKRFLG